MKVYLAARWTRRDEMRIYADDLAQRGHTCTSQWLYGNTFGDDGHRALTDAESGMCATVDLANIDAADIIVCFTEHPGSGAARGGRHVELGYALGRGDVYVIVVGPIENVFCVLSDRVDTWDEALQCIEAVPE